MEPRHGEGAKPEHDRLWSDDRFGDDAAQFLPGDPPEQACGKGTKFLGIEPYIASTCPCRGGVRCVDARDARLNLPHSRSSGQPQPAVGTHYCRNLQTAFHQHGVEAGSPFTADRDFFQMDYMTVPAEELKTDSMPACRNKWLLIYVTFAGPQAAVHVRNGSAIIDGSAAATSETCKGAHYARPERVSFD